MPVVYAVSPDFVSSLNHAIKQPDVLVAPVRFTPVRMFDSVRMDRISVGNQEKCGGKTILVEDRNGLFELTSQSVVEGEGNKCWFVHCLATIVFHSTSVLSGRRLREFPQCTGRKGIRGDFVFFRFEVRLAKKELPEGEDRGCENGE